MSFILDHTIGTFWSICYFAFFSPVLTCETSCILFHFLLSFCLSTHHMLFWCSASCIWCTSYLRYKLRVLHFVADWPDFFIASHLLITSLLEVLVAGSADVCFDDTIILFKQLINRLYLLHLYCVLF